MRCMEICAGATEDQGMNRHVRAGAGSSDADGGHMDQRAGD